MHSQETKHKFIELRAKDLSLSRIADELGVAKSTLVIWNHEFGIEIENLRQMELERLREQLLGSQADRLQSLARDYQRYTKELERREPEQARACASGELCRRCARHRASRVLEAEGGAPGPVAVDGAP